MKILNKDGAYFKLNKTLLKKFKKRPDIINGLYVAVYEEFKGAIEQPHYSKLTVKQRFEKLNEFAFNWLNKRGFLDG
jgi:hypothetical protein